MISHSLPKPPHFVLASDPLFRGFWHCWDSLHVVNGLLVKPHVKDGAATAYTFVVPTGPSRGGGVGGVEGPGSTNVLFNENVDCTLEPGAMKYRGARTCSRRPWVPT